MSDFDLSKITGYEPPLETDDDLRSQLSTALAERDAAQHDAKQYRFAVVLSRELIAKAEKERDAARDELALRESGRKVDYETMDELNDKFKKAEKERDAAVERAEIAEAGNADESLSVAYEHGYQEAKKKYRVFAKLWKRCTKRWRLSQMWEVDQRYDAEQRATEYKEQRDRLVKDALTVITKMKCSCDIYSGREMEFKDAAIRIEKLAQQIQGGEPGTDKGKT